MQNTTIQKQYNVFLFHNPFSNPPYPQTFVLDFITEYYIWCGKGVPLSVRKKALQLAEEEYKKSVAECPKNPIVPPQVGVRLLRYFNVVIV